MGTITRYRGDTAADEFTIQDDAGQPVNITSFSFILSVNTLKNPPDGTTELFRITGTILDAPNGVVEFTPSPLQANQSPGKYFYDVQMTDAGGRVRTIDKGLYKFLQDITK